MPLLEMSPNVREPEALGRKRSHDEYSNDVVKADKVPEDKTPSKSNLHPIGDSLLLPIPQNLIESSPQGSPALTEAGSSTPARNSPSPQTPTKSSLDSDKPANLATNSSQAHDSNNPPPPKRKKLTTEEKEARDKEANERKEAKEKEANEKKQEREEKALQRAAEKAKLEEEKVARAKERDDKRKKKDEEERLKTEQKEEKKRQKEDEQKRLQEEKDKKARSQPKLSSFFMMPKTPSKTGAGSTTPKQQSPLKAQVDATVEKEIPGACYRKLFKEFYIRDNTKLAPPIPNVDAETLKAKSNILDDCINGNRSAMVTSFNPTELLALPRQGTRRGKLYPSVKATMESAYKEMTNSGTSAPGTTSDAIAVARSTLHNVPVKIIAFSQDVRPPYYGTITSRPFVLGQTTMLKQARQSSARLLPLDYDDDSEAEWQEEEGEDLDADDGEEELDDEDDMDGFLDDSEDSGLARNIFGNVMEPECTGLCFENDKRQTFNESITGLRMEIIHDLSTTGSIDPFSTSYWQPELKTNTGPAAATTDKMGPPPAPVNAFAALNGGAAPAGDVEQPKLVKQEFLNDFKKAILDNKALSKVGIIDYIFQQFRDNVSRIEVKNTLELVAEKKKGTGRSKEWDLKPGHEIQL